ncbi:VOC family protein [Sphingomonas sp.]|jgi:catechol 2,3-dioxygenase-like lactoylglutathione lyase family enzyme|uniref:VOC family protein n=1 Tax=Sphingomonas sp. TaxID=28214 RepID=UPI002E148868|nr:VOC family protein [Sphingomonas sp.]
MFSHIMLGANDVAASKAFYDATLGTLGARAGSVDPKGRAFYMHNGGIFMLSKPLDGQPACHANGGTVGFAATSPEMVDAWHAAGLAHGGTAIEDPPGIRENAFGALYLAYLRDPAGNKVCAMYRVPKAG